MSARQEAEELADRVMQASATRAEGQALRLRNIKQRVEQGIDPRNIQVTVNHFPELPEVDYVQVDEIDPVLGNTFSSNPMELRSFGYDIPDTKTLLKLPTGKYRLSDLIAA